MNKIIKEELYTRMTLARDAMVKVPKKMQGLLEYYDKQNMNNLVNKMANTLKEAFWWEDQTTGIQAAGFEWYYDGSETPEALGYGFSTFEKLPDLTNFTVGKSKIARDDFDGDLEFGTCEFSDSGGFDLGEACFPLYTYLDIEGTEHNLTDDFINLYTTRMFYAMHLAMGIVVNSEEFKKLNTTKPFYFFANNHDWNPCLIYQLGDEEVKVEDYGDDDSLIVDELDKFLKKLEKTRIKKMLKEDYLSSLAKGSIEALEKALFDLPQLKSGGHALKLPIKEVGNFCWRRLSEEDTYKNLDFEALKHYCKVTVTDKKSNLYSRHYPLVYLYANNPEKAHTFIIELISDNEDLKEELISGYKDILRWARDEHQETRWPNPSFILHKDTKAQEVMSKIFEGK